MFMWMFFKDVCWGGMHTTIMQLCILRDHSFKWEDYTSWGLKYWEKSIKTEKEPNLMKVKSKRD